MQIEVGSVVKYLRNYTRKGINAGSIGIITKPASLSGKFWRVAFENREINVHITEMEVIA